MSNKLEKSIAKMFLIGKNFRNCYELRDRFILFYYYELDDATKRKVDLSTLWGTVYREYENSI